MSVRHVFEAGRRAIGGGVEEADWLIAQTDGMGAPTKRTDGSIRAVHLDVLDALDLYADAIRAKSPFHVREPLRNALKEAILESYDSERREALGPPITIQGHSTSR